MFKSVGFNYNYNYNSNLNEPKTHTTTCTYNDRIYVNCRIKLHSFAYYFTMYQNDNGFWNWNKTALWKIKRVLNKGITTRKDLNIAAMKRILKSWCCDCQLHYTYTQESSRKCCFFCSIFHLKVFEKTKMRAKVKSYKTAHLATFPPMQYTISLLHLSKQLRSTC